MNQKNAQKLRGLEEFLHTVITGDSSTPTKQELAVSSTCRSFAAVGTLLLAELSARKPSLPLLHAEHSLIAASCSEFHGFPTNFFCRKCLTWLIPGSSKSS